MPPEFILKPGTKPCELFLRQTERPRLSSGTNKELEINLRTTRYNYHPHLAETRLPKIYGTAEFGPALRRIEGNFQVLYYNGQNAECGIFFSVANSVSVGI